MNRQKSLVSRIQMKALRGWVVTLLLTLSLLPGLTQVVKPFVHPLFADNMVLQREMKVSIWGWTIPGASVVVSMEEQTAKTQADNTGKWTAFIGPFPAGGPYTLTVKGEETRTFNNVMMGDVWICSGQSNMDMGIKMGQDAEKEIARANNPMLRLFIVEHRYATTPQELLRGQWRVCTPSTVAQDGWEGFSAVAYFFGRQLVQDVKIPIGLIQVAWGGTVAESWTSAQGLKPLRDFAPALKAAAESTADYEQKVAAWYQALDPGSAGGGIWASPSFDSSSWKTMSLPGYWEKAGLVDFDGIVWFRKEVDIPESWAGKPLSLHLGPIDENDTTWFNETMVGQTEQYDVAREYPIPGNLVKAGKAVIAVRVLDTGSNGGFNGKPEQMQLQLQADDQSAIPLAGFWQYMASVPYDAKTMTVPKHLDINTVTALFNGMVNPLIPYGITGVTWYQGEANVGRAQQYEKLLPAMIQDWRSRFGVGDFPFLLVQLANFIPQGDGSGTSWAALREAQLMTVKQVPNTALIVAMDIGDAHDIHPKNKQEVGRRLALAAEALTYKLPVEYSGPFYHGMQIKGNKIILTFTQVGGGLMIKGDALQGLTIAGKDQKFVPALAEIAGNTLVVSSPDIPNPVAVRYGWADNIACNLYNKAGLPASPFRTDAW